ncbi:MAG: FAD:protein FMN transferase [Mycobacteriales bacterium]
MTIATSPPATALGTYVELAVTEAPVLPEANALLSAELAAIDAACSRFRADSELSAVNATPGRPVPAGPLLRLAVRVAIRAAQETDGLVDPTLGRELIAAGYDRDFAELVSRQGGWPTLAPQRHLPHWRAIVVDDAGETITVPPGCRLDLGATAKALAADRAAAQIAGELEVGVLVSLGGDIAMAGDPPEDGWAVRTAVSDVEGDDGETVLLNCGGMATSSPEVRQWRRGAEQMHHILDPRTGQPASPMWRGVTVAANSCVEANTRSTAAVVLGPRATAWLGAADVAARLVGLDGRIVRLGAWPAPSEWSL